MSITENEKAAVISNLFPAAVAAVANDVSFPWHRVRKVITAQFAHSSQALAIDFFGTLKGLVEPNRVLDAFATRWGLPVEGMCELSLERTIPLTTLGETKSTQVDAAPESKASLIFFECKFTESDGGSCSQVNPLSGHTRDRGKIQCNGNYVEQENPVNGITSRCSLTGKGIRYWDIVPRVLSVRNDQNHKPCPFKGGWYQWMRNLVACRELVKDRCLEPEGVGRGMVYFVPWMRHVSPGEGAFVSDIFRMPKPQELTGISQELSDKPHELASEPQDLTRKLWIDLADLPTAELTKLEALSSSVREKRRVSSQLMRDTVLQLCLARFLGLRVLAHLLGRDATDLNRRVLNGLIREGGLRRAFPRPNDPRQAYTSSPITEKGKNDA